MVPHTRAPRLVGSVAVVHLLVLLLVRLHVSRCRWLRICRLWGATDATGALASRLLLLLLLVVAGIELRLKLESI